VRPPLIVLLCATSFANACSIGAFPSLLPEIARDTAIADWQLGLFAGAFGFARMVADVPAGLFIARRLAGALIAGSIALAAGTLTVAAADAFPMLVAGRALMGVGHALNMVAGLTAILHAQAARRLSVALNAFEFSAMIGLLTGAGLVALLPSALTWKAVFLTACAPQIFALLGLPAVLARLPRRWEARAASVTASPEPRTGGLVILAFAAGSAVAIAYSSVEQLVIPVRGSREFGLDRAGIARLFMLMQTCDIAALIPLGLLADRAGSVRVLAGVTFALAIGSVLIGFGPLVAVVAGGVLFGLGMAGWMLPLSVLRHETPAGLIAWRTALYRVGVDAGLFLGPVLGGLVANRHLAVVALVLVIIGVSLIVVDRRVPVFEPAPR
jgi:DHA1 family inner membrane transport protein